MPETKAADIVVTCPCCAARLTIDARLRKVIAHEEPPRERNAPDLDQAALLLREQAARREAVFQKSSEDMKIQSQVLERKFAEALKKSQDQPVTKPTRDIDLD